MKKSEDAGLSDLLMLGETALSALIGAAREFPGRSGEGAEFIARKLNLVSREEFDAAFTMIKKARTIQDDLATRLTKLEKESKPKKTSPAKTKKSPPARK